MNGAAVYSPAVLATYDAWVLGVGNRWIWRCPTSRLLAHYQQHVTGNHLDVGVGTGYYLDRCRFPVAQPRLGLLDANPHALRWAARRVARYRPEVHTGDICQPLALETPPYDSLALHYVLHCLAGGMQAKGDVLERLRGLLRPGGVLFGATLLGREIPASATARWLMARYNRLGIFSNTDDDPDALRELLTRHFRDVSVTLCGCAALFSARAP